MRLRICFIGSFSGNLDEGMRNVAEALADIESEEFDVLRLNPKSVITESSKLKAFNPDVIHYLSGPSFVSLALLHLARMQTKCKATLITATHPWLPGMKLFPERLKPNLLLYQSSKQKEAFAGIFNRMRFLPNGVDQNRFKPLIQDAKMSMRRSLGLSQEKFIILHVGNFREGRNIGVLGDLARCDDHEVVLVGSTSVGRISTQMKKELREKGVKIIDQYVSKIEEIYASCDCYLFPTQEEGRAIEIPLSVLEAMACNLPIVSTRFGGLPDLFTDQTWFRFVNDSNEIKTAIADIRKRIEEGETKCNTRSMVAPFTWESIGSELSRTYNKLLLDPNQEN